MSNGEIIKKLRTEIGMTQTELAEKIGTSKQNIYKYENGIITNIPSDRLQALSDVFGVSPAIFFKSPAENENSTPQTERDVLKQRIIELLSQLTDDELKEAARFLAYLISSQDK